MPYFLYLILRWCPGAVGIILRQKLYRRILKECGRKVLIGRYVDLKNPRAITLGNGVILNDYACLDASKATGSETVMMIGDGVFVGASTTLTAGPATMTIEEGSNIGSGCMLSARSVDMKLEHHALLAGFCMVGTQQAENMQTEHAGRPALAPPFSTLHTVLGGGCWLGLRSHVRTGCEIGEGAIIGAHAFVDDSIPSYTIAFGQPARVVRNRP